MSNVSTVAQYSQAVTPAVIAAGIAYVVKLVGPAKVAKLAADVERDAPAVGAAVKDAEKIPAVKAAVEDVEKAADAEAAKLNAATHGAIDVLAAELARTVPQAIQDAIVAAHAAATPPAATPPVVDPVTVVGQ
jgi:hypothetical protein